MESTGSVCAEDKHKLELAENGEELSVVEGEKPKDDISAVVETVKQEVEQKSKSNNIKEEDEKPTTVIAISDAEEDVPAVPLQNNAKSKKRSNTTETGSGGVAAVPFGDLEEHARLKRRKIKAAGAPKMPLNGYVRYMNDRRETLRKEHPNKSANDHTRMIGEEWHQLPKESKAPYMEAAELDRQRYNVELQEFLKSHPDVLASELAKSKGHNKSSTLDDTVANPALKEKLQSNGNQKQTASTASSNLGKGKEESTLPVAATDSHPSSHQKTFSHQATSSTMVPAHNLNTDTTTITNNSNINGSYAGPITQGEIPIFTNEFLEHNKACDMELRTLRKSKTDLEQQNAVLEKHVENMKSGVKKLATENDELQEKNRLLQLYLDKMKRKLAKALAGLAIPSEPNGATVDNIDKYMSDLFIMATSNTHGPASLNKAKDIIRKLDLQISL